MAHSKAGARKLQGEPGTSCAKKWESAPKKLWGHVEKTQKAA